MQTVSDVMTRGIRTLAPTDSLTLAAGHARAGRGVDSCV